MKNSQRMNVFKRNFHQKNDCSQMNREIGCISPPFCNAIPFPTPPPAAAQSSCAQTWMWLGGVYKIIHETRMKYQNGLTCVYRDTIVLIYFHCLFLSFALVSALEPEISSTFSISLFPLSFPPARFSLIKSLKLIKECNIDIRSPLWCPQRQSLGKTIKVDFVWKMSLNLENCIITRCQARQRIE